MRNSTLGLRALALGLVLGAHALAQEVVINELMADNRQTIANGGRSPDWIELRNTLPLRLDLAGWRLSDNPADPGKYTFPEGVSLSPYGYLVVWADDDHAAPGLHTGFALSADAGQVLLSAPSALIGKVDAVSYGLQLQDLAIGRRPEDGGWTLCQPTPGTRNIPQALGNAAALRVNEWMAAPSSGEDWFEIFNPDALPVDVGGLALTDDMAQPPKSVLPALSYIAEAGFLLFWADDKTNVGPRHVGFKLAQAGDTIALLPPVLIPPINAVNFGPQQTGVSQGFLPDGSGELANFPKTDSPGESNYLPLREVVINEVLSHTDPPLEDAVEFYNPGDKPVDMSGWYLSNQPGHPQKYRLPQGSVIQPRGFLVIYEYQFNAHPNLPGNFTFNSAHGDQAVLSQTAFGNLTGYRVSQKFGTAQNGVSFGRISTSTGTVFTAQRQISFGVDNPQTLQQFQQGQGQANIGPYIGPAVLNEIQYHPPVVVVGGVTNDNTLEEFVELRSVTNAPLPLFDPGAPENTWHLAGTVDFRFPAGLTLAPDGYLLVVGFDPVKQPSVLAEFRARYAVPGDVPVLGPWQGKLLNSGETLELYKPDPPQRPPHPDAGFVPYVLVDRVRYSDGFPWPPEADGDGPSLQRQDPPGYGDDAVNWFAAGPTAGRANGGVVVPVIDAYGFVGDVFSLTFTAQGGLSYTVQFATELGEAHWSRLQDVPGESLTRLVTVIDPTAGAGRRYYRLTSPAQP